MEKSYEREELDHASSKTVPATAPAALSDTPPSWPTNLRRRSSIEDDTNASNTTTSATKEASAVPSIPPLPISSRESSIDTVLTHQSPSKTPEISSAYVNPTNIWDKNEVTTDLNEPSESIIEEKFSGIEDSHIDELKANKDRKEDDFTSQAIPITAKNDDHCSYLTESG